MENKGKYTVLEGSDGVGKSTQLSMLRQRLDSLEIEAVYTREPGGDTPLGREVRRVLLSPDVPISSHLAEVALFTADRAEQWATIIEPALRSNKLVVSDRNWYSTLAYQTASHPNVEEKIIAVTKALLPEQYTDPDLALVLTLSESERKRRRDLRETGNRADSFELRDEEFFSRVYEAYEMIPRKMGAIAISADAEPDTVFEQVWRQYEAVLSA